MSRVFGDPVNVWVDETGRPTRFIWREQLHPVRRVLEHWVATRDWWRRRDPDADDHGEREFWRVEASAGDSIMICELRFDAATRSWLLSRVWD
ncbi:nucleotidyltransferase [Actinomadura craniellae]|uniref:Nucleotidyltransferase n=1 Tax=Actinomadura craniellae TaxID=2231787 RepID=A0A365GYF4_9ACTN|nr:DUF6504 family protein [Actinomadura craniellae]RAY11842.1 nucleotidyltransferase [Actinomadura craniellae]